MDRKAADLIASWQKRNISGIYCDNKQEAGQKLLEIIPVSASVGFCGSQTLEEIGIVKELECRGNKVFNPYKPKLSQQKNLEIRRQGAFADFYLASANAISQNGELVFFSAYGNRTGGISSAKNVIVVAGVNKITPNLAEALKRAREYATPLNCKRLNWNSACLEDRICRKEICFFPEYKRMCCQILIIEAEIMPKRLKVVLVGENLGF
jgi:hypothetical protein